MKLEHLKKELKGKADKKKAAFLARFFKTGPGEYAEGDLFLGIVVPEIRKISKNYLGIGLKDAVGLLRSKFHEERLLALLILISKYAKGDETAKDAVYRAYLANTKYINNWDLVDLTAPHIVGAHLADKDKSPLLALARSGLIWERRISVLASFHFIRNNIFDHTLEICKILLRDEEDLIHKAVGWMLREVGKRDIVKEEEFLKDRYMVMPRTMLRYAIERFPEAKRRAYLKGSV